jgi:hypothetical protein
MSLAAMLPRALIAWLGGDRSYRQREPAALVLTAAAGAGRGQLGVRQALLPPARLPGIPGTSNRAMHDRRAARSSASRSLVDSGVPDAQVAAWAGHSVDMLRRVYAGRAQGLEGIWITRMDQTLPRDQP